MFLKTVKNIHNVHTNDSMITENNTWKKTQINESRIKEPNK